MALGFEFVIIQVAISIVGYILHQYYDIDFKKVLGFAAALSIIFPLVTLDIKNANQELLISLIQHYVEMIPQQIIGFIIGSVLTGICHTIRVLLNYLHINLR